MLFLIIVWAFLLVISFQIGTTLLVFTRSGSFRLIGDRFVVSVWLGIIVISNVLLSISIFSRLSPFVFLIVSFGLLLSSMILSGNNLLKILHSHISLPLIFGFMALLLAISFVSTQVVTWYDTGVYHFGAIKWLSKYGTVPGLALIYYGFGYATSWFALAAPFNNGILEARSCTVTGGLAFVMFIVHFCICLVRIITQRAWMEDWFLVISSLLALLLITRYEIYISPSTDLPVMIL
ncbi:MAG: LIC_10190 family membrane protein, partial [Planctomycetota bacterium]